MVATASYTIPEMVRAHSRGETTRGRIMREIRAARDAGQPTPTASEIARRLGIGQPAVSRQLANLASMGELVRIQVASGVYVYRLPNAE